MSAAFDAELYLRLAGERALAAGSSPHHHGPTPLSVAVEALVAAGAIERAAAAAVLKDYTLAAALRGDHMSLYALQEGDEDDEPPPRPATEPLSPVRVVPCEKTIELGSWTLHIHLASLSERETSLAVTLTRSGGRRRRRGPMLMGGGGPAAVTLGDDRGNRRTAHFGGGGGESEWTGHFQAEPGLAPDTAYVDFDGERIELSADEVPPAEVWIEDLPALDPAIRHLWARVAPERHMHEEPLVEPAIDALVAAGTLAPDDPALVDIRAVAEALHHGAMHGGPSSRAKALPEPWRSVLRRANRRGPAGTLAVNAVTPVFDGFSVAVSSLVSDEDSWQIAVEVAPDLWFAPFGPALEESPGLEWWALDDRGHHYLGSIGSWSGGDARGQGDIHFGGALDRKAEHVDILPTAATQRAVIRLPLDWPA